MCGTLFFIIDDLAWYIDPDTYMAQIFVRGYNSDVRRSCAAYSKLRVIVQHLQLNLTLTFTLLIFALPEEPFTSVCWPTQT